MNYVVPSYAISLSIIWLRKLLKRKVITFAKMGVENGKNGHVIFVVKNKRT